MGDGAMKIDFKNYGTFIRKKYKLNNSLTAT
jgi:hypothetical protein